MTIADVLRDGVDAAVAAVSPGLAMRRAGARAMAQVLDRATSRRGDRAQQFRESAYEGARTKRTNAGWRASDGSADADLDADSLATLRERSRDRVRNDAVASAAINALVDNIVGTGMRPRLALEPSALGITPARADELGKIADDLWDEWGTECETTGRLDGDDLQAMVVSQCFVNGDMALAPKMLAPRGDSRFETCLELIEGDRIDDPLGMSRPNVRAGVEIDEETGRPVAYWVARHHPGDVRIPGSGLVRGSRLFDRLPAVNALGRPNVIHVFSPERPGQSRGRPYFSAVLNLFRDLDDYFESELIASQVAACFAVFVTKKDPFSAALARATDATRGNKERHQELSPAMVEYLSPGESIETANPGRPNNAFGEFIGRVVRTITSALGMPYEVSARDFHGTTYSQARAALVEARRMFARRQQWLIRRCLQRIWRLVLEEAWLKGWFPAGDDFGMRPRAWTRTHWETPAWGWIDPEKELKAAKLKIALGMSTRAQEIQNGVGGHWRDVMRQLAREEQEAGDLGINVSARDDEDQEPEPAEAAEPEEAAR